MFNRISGYINKICDTIDEIKSNHMKRYIECGMKRDSSLVRYEIDYQKEDFIEDFFINIFCLYITEMSKILKRIKFFKKFYKKYMADSIKLTNSRDFLDHSSLDAIMLPIEAALFRFFNYGKSLDSNKLRDKIVPKIRRKINCIEIYCYNFKEDISETRVKFKDLLKEKTYPTLDNLRCKIGEFNNDIDYLFEELFFKSAFSILFVEFIRDSLETNSKLIKDMKFDDLKQDIYLYFVRNTGSYLKVYDLLSNTFDNIQEFSNAISNIRRKSSEKSDGDKDVFEKNFLEESKEILEKSDIISVLERLHEFCYRNYKLVTLTIDESKNISDEILFILNKLRNKDLSDFNVVHGSLLHLNFSVKLILNKVNEIIKTKESLDLSSLFNEYMENSITNNESRLFINPVFRKYIKG